MMCEASLGKNARDFDVVFNSDSVRAKSILKSDSFKWSAS